MTPDPKAKFASAREWLRSSERRQQIDRDKQQQNERLERSKHWLAKYLARPRRTSFNWSPRYPMTAKEPEHEAE